MSQSIPPLSPTDFTAAPAAPVSSGLAIGALACGIGGFCLPGLGLVGIVLGIIAIVQASAKPPTQGGKGMAIGGIVAGTFSLVFIPVLAMLVGIMLPALGAARNSARQLRSQVNVEMIDQSLLTYAAGNKDWFPEPGADWQGRLKADGLDATFLVSPRAGMPAPIDSYIYVPGFNRQAIKDPTKALLVYENPKYVKSGSVAFAYADGHVDSHPVADVEEVLGEAEKPEDGKK